MSELIEIVARAICDVQTWPGAWTKANGVEQRDWRYQALAALRAIEGAGYEVGPGWQPIETAPRGDLLLYFPAIYNERRRELSHGAWITVSHANAFSHRKPTHWRPLPGPPAFDAAPTVGGEDNG